MTPGIAALLITAAPNSFSLANVAAKITHPISLAAYGIAAIVYILSRRSNHGKVPMIAWVSVLALALTPVLTSTVLEIIRIQQNTLYHLAVAVYDPQGQQIDDAQVRDSLGDYANKAYGAWQLDIPQAKRPSDGKITITAEVPNAFLAGSQEVTLAGDRTLQVKVRLVHAEVDVRGTVRDNAGRAIEGARVSVEGYESILTKADGSFVLPAHAAKGQQVLLHAEKPGYQATSLSNPAGDAAPLILEREIKTKKRR